MLTDKIIYILMWVRLFPGQGIVNCIGGESKFNARNQVSMPWSLLPAEDVMQPPSAWLSWLPDRGKSQCELSAKISPFSLRFLLSGNFNRVMGKDIRQIVSTHFYVKFVLPPELFFVSHLLWVLSLIIAGMISHFDASLCCRRNFINLSQLHLSCPVPL